MATAREIMNLIQCKIQFSTRDGDFEGKVRLVSPINAKAVIDNVFSLTDRMHLGTLTLFCNEITNCIILNRSGIVDKEEKTSSSFQNHPSHESDVCKQWKKYERLDDNFDTVNFAHSSETYALKLPPGFNNIPTDVVTLNDTGSEFHQALKQIKSETFLGMSFEGPKLGRYGNLSWLCISTSCCTFVFDVQKIGKTLFEKGLREIFENCNIKKIIHDCREVSDCLYHMFDTKLEGVFDTQIADKLVSMQKDKVGNFNNHVRSLNLCLQNHLQVPEEFLFELPQRYAHRVLLFQMRPPMQMLMDLMLKNVVYLRLLKYKLELAMLNPFRRSVEVYLQVVQGMSDQELKLEPNEPNEFPREMLLEGLEVVQYKESVQVPSSVTTSIPSQKTNEPFHQFQENYERRDIISIVSQKHQDYCERRDRISIVSQQLGQDYFERQHKANRDSQQFLDTCEQREETKTVSQQVRENCERQDKTNAVSQQLEENCERRGRTMVSPEFRENCEQRDETNSVSQQFQENCKRQNKNVLSETLCNVLRRFRSSGSSTSLAIKKSEAESSLEEKFNAEVCQKQSPKSVDSDNKSKCTSNDSDDGVISHSDGSLVSDGSELGETGMLKSYFTNSRRELDEAFSRECYKIGCEQEEVSSTEGKQNVNISEPDDPWACFRTDVSKYYDANEKDKRETYRFVPAGTL